MPKDLLSETYAAVEQRLVQAEDVQVRCRQLQAQLTVMRQVLALLFFAALLGATFTYNSLILNRINAVLPPLLTADAPLKAVTINNRRVPLDEERTVVIGNRAVVSIRSVLDTLRATVKWDAGTDTVTGRAQGVLVEVTNNSQRARINDAWVVLDIPAQVVEGKTMVPLNLVEAIPGARVEWAGPRQPTPPAALLVNGVLYLLRFTLALGAVSSLVQAACLTGLSTCNTRAERLKQYLAEQRANLTSLDDKFQRAIADGETIKLAPRLNVDQVLQACERQLAGTYDPKMLLLVRMVSPGAKATVLAATTLGALIVGDLAHRELAQAYALPFAHSDYVVIGVVTALSTWLIYHFLKDTPAPSAAGRRAPALSGER
jgi:hypothetical protein